MTDDNTIDITDRLPPVEVRKPWRQKVPDYYVKHIDDLVVMQKSVAAICCRLRHQHLRLLKNADHAHYAPRGELEALEAAVVMRKCAEEKLWYAVPVEEFMTPGLNAREALRGWR
jgi:hypothetical protein